MYFSNSYPTSLFRGSKHFMLSSYDGSFGGDQKSLYTYSFVVGTLSMMLGLTVLSLSRYHHLHRSTHIVSYIVTDRYLPLLPVSPR